MPLVSPVVSFPQVSPPKPYELESQNVKCQCSLPDCTVLFQYYDVHTTFHETWSWLFIHVLNSISMNGVKSAKE
jgi:hypothetical protein